ncbi:MAG: phasin family protein [Pseudomonadota bacterium]
MSDKPDFEIPQSMRDIAERNIEQAREAYERFMDMTKKAQAMAPNAAGPLGAPTDRLQRKALDFAEENMEASFSFASELAQATDMTEALRLQQEFAQAQMQSYLAQTQEMTQAMTSLATRAGDEVEKTVKKATGKKKPPRKK